MQMRALGELLHVGLRLFDLLEMIHHLMRDLHGHRRAADHRKSVGDGAVQNERSATDRDAAGKIIAAGFVRGQPVVNQPSRIGTVRATGNQAMPLNFSLGRREKPGQGFSTQG